MSPLDDQTQRLQERAARYRRMSALLGEDEATGRLRVLAREIDRQVAALRQGQELIRRAQEARAASYQLTRYNAVLHAEIDSVLARIRGNPRQGHRFRDEDVKEESRLCVEEAEAAADRAMRQSLASQALTLAQLAEQMKREG